MAGSAVTIWLLRPTAPEGQRVEGPPPLVLLHSVTRAPSHRADDRAQLLLETPTGGWIRSGIVASEPLTLWSDGANRCLLQRVDGGFQLLMLGEGRIDRVETCSSEHQARNKAQAWVAELEETRQQEPATRQA